MGVILGPGVSVTKKKFFFSIFLKTIFVNGCHNTQSYKGAAMQKKHFLAHMDPILADFCVGRKNAQNGQNRPWLDPLYVLEDDVHLS